MGTRTFSTRFTRITKFEMRSRTTKISLLYLICLPLAALLVGLAATTPTALAVCPSAVNFGSPTLYNTINPNPVYVAIGDINKDGKLDLVTAHSGKQLNTLLGSGTGTFAPDKSVATNGIPVGQVALGNLNSGGFLDAVLPGSDSDKVVVVLNVGAAGSPLVDGLSAPNPIGLALGDFNGDGKLDVVTANGSDNNISLLKGDGAGSFGIATLFPTGANTYPVFIAVGDFNGDGKLDVVTANSVGNSVGMLLGNGAGSFGAATAYSLGGGHAPHALAVGDFNGDGKLDIVTANEDTDNISLLLGNGNGTFGAATTYGLAGGDDPVSVAVADFNGDGKLDVVTANSQSNNLSLLLGNGAGGFGSPTNIAVGTALRSVAVGDFNGDGRPDLAVVNQASPAGVYILLNNALTPKLVVTAPAATSVGAPFSVTVTAQDGCGNTLTGYTGTVHFTSSDGAAILPANYTFTLGDAGVHTFVNGVTLNTVGSRTITATDTINASLTGSATVNVLPSGLTFKVTNLNDSGSGSLRQAMLDANSAGGANTINFNPSLYGTINLASALPNISSSMTINGPGANRVVVRRNSGGNYRIFTLQSPYTATISGLNITNGNTTTGGGIQNGGNLTLKEVLVYANLAATDGGGVYNETGATLTVIRSTIAHNSAQNGGGLFNRGGLTITNSTLFGNIATGSGGGLANALGTAALTNTTIAGNIGGGITISGGAVGLKNSILANNTPGGNNCNNPVNDGGNNLSSDGSCAFAAFNNTNPLLGPLTNNGGPTPTLALQPTSAAINSGNAANCPPTDQRGYPRFGVCDLGSFEFDPASANDTWARATSLASGQTIDEFISTPGASKWYKFEAGPDSKINLTLTGVSTTELPDNYDLNFYRNIQESYSQLTNPQNIQTVTAQASTSKALTSGYLTSGYLTSGYLTSGYLTSGYLTSGYLTSGYLTSGYLPTKLLPAGYLNELFKADEVVPPGLDSQAYSGAQILSLIAVSANEGLSAENIFRPTYSNSGPFYVRVSSRNGAFSAAKPFRLKIEVTGGVCGTTLPTVSGAAPPTPAQVGNVDSVILTDSSRLLGSDGNPLNTNAAEKSAFFAKLNTLASDSKVNGAVVDLADPAYGRVAAANTLADGNKTCAYLKNVVANEIKAVIDTYRGTTAKLKYVVLLGPDNTLPFYRYPDVAGQANEKTYSPPVKPLGSLDAALQSGLVLGQDEYGSTAKITRNDYAFPLPGASVGRLIETAPEITRLIDLYLGLGPNKALTPQSALITGYDLVADSAEAVKQQLQAGINASTCDQSTSLCNANITPQNTPPNNAASWNAAYLNSQFVNKKHDLVFLAGHFSAYDAQAANYTSFLTSAEFAAADQDQSNILFFSVGCHSGYNIPGSDTVLGASQRLEPDWAQAIARKGGTAIIGTGYQYGDDQTIGYSEQLYLDFTKQLRSGTGQVTNRVGEALIQAKRNYLATNPTVSGMDQKVVLQATLYGLPMLGVTMQGLPPSADPVAIGVPGTVGANPGQALGLSSTDFLLNPVLTPQSRTLTNPVDNSTVTAEYFSGSQGTVNNPLEPILPLESRNVTAGGKILRGVGFRSGSYTDLTDKFPLTSVPGFELGPLHPTFESSVFYPTQLWSTNYYDALNGQNVRVLATPSQFKSNAPGSTKGTIRKYSQMQFRNYYIPDTAGANPTNSAALAAAPSISEVAGNLVGANLLFSVKVTGNGLAGVQEAWITYTANNGLWQSLDLTRSAFDPTIWQGSMPLGALSAANFRFMVQAANGTGLVTLATNSGAYFALDTVPPQTKTSLSFLTVPSTANYLDTPTLKAVLKFNNGSGDQFLANQPISFDLGGQSVTAITNANGEASVNNGPGTGSLVIRQSQGTFFLNVNFAGSGTYQLTSASNLLTINKRPTDLGLTVPSPAVQFGTSTGVKATLSHSNPKQFLSEKLVVFTATGSTGTFSKSVFTNFVGEAALETPEWPAGDYTLTVSFAGDELYAASSSSGSPLKILPVTITVSSGSPQSVTINEPFAPLKVVVKNGNNQPVSGVIVTFKAPTSGPSGTFGYPGIAQLATAKTDANGIATAPLFTANGIVGGPYIVTASVNGASSPANFSLTNLLPQPSGKPYGWGGNIDGQLGNNTTNDSYVPVGVLNLSKVRQVAAGDEHSLALTKDGKVYAWGEDFVGQLGNGTTSDHVLVPVLVGGLPNNIVAVAAGYGYSLALTQDGKVYAWGANESGQLGNNSTVASSTPVLVSGLTDAKAIAAGGSHVLALRSDGSVVAWGKNNAGQLGDNTTTNRKTPVPVIGLIDVKAIGAGGWHSLAVQTRGQAVAWGLNSSGQLGNNSTTNSKVPVQVNGLTDAVAVAGGEKHSLALRSNGSVVAWGNNGSGRLGNGTTTSSKTPVAVSGLSGVQAIAAGGSHSLALTTGGKVYAWGLNDNGQLGNGTNTFSKVPVLVTGLNGVISIAGGDAHSLAVVATP